jgi:hypothetical protein
MAINKNHEFGELDGIKCAIVENNVSNDRAIFLKDLLVLNGYTVVIAPTPPPIVTAKPVAEEASKTVATPEQLPTFVLGVTDQTFNTINAIFGRVLKSPSGHVVTQAYWNQLETESFEDIPYYEHTKLVHPQ